MDGQELLAQVRALRATGRSPKQIARALGVPPAAVAPLVKAIAAADQAGASERKLLGCWVSPGWSQGSPSRATLSGPMSMPPTPAPKAW
jgi:hypothetical protein